MSKTLRLSEAEVAATTLPSSSPGRTKVGPKLEPQGNSETRLNQIRKAGCALLFRHGYSGMTMREIAASLHIKAASLYHHFPSKQHILFDVMNATVTELLEGLREITNSTEEPEIQLDAAIRWHVLFHTQRREEAFVSYSEMRSLEQENLRIVLKLRRDYERFFDNILKKGRRKGVFQFEELSVTRNCILTMCTATANWFSPEGPLSADEVAGQISRFVSSALVKGEAASLADSASLPSSAPSVLVSPL